MTDIEKYWHSYAESNGLTLKTPDSWMFGDGSKALGDELVNLVLSGKKTGTCAAKESYIVEKEAIPKVGQYDIILNGDSKPVAIIKYTKIEEIPMNQVSKAFAISEGEGDLTYEYWYKEHEIFFINEFRDYGLTYTPEIILVCQNFEVVFPNITH
ncbi:ASCH domain-containing protein [Marinilactibacillus sp. XAAS-LB27]|uniref:ASCH domain-containing protein n=1 Tax=Marinilactibacillus sp. XAAS-LB27 TaxID=3114538 RepID=UPI002E197BEE|nr:ASCH domain-containing protein [Marinilactibacillus sp. XAAS-LB27]